MAQKINPLGFRLGTTQNHHSLWFAQPKNYSQGLQEDKKIRNSIQNYVQKNIKIPSGVVGISRIEIQKRIDVIQVRIYLGFQKLLIERNPKKIKEFQMNVMEELKKMNVIEELQMIVQKELNPINQKLNINLTRIPKPYKDPNILAEFIAEQLKNRVSFRKAIKKAIELAKRADTKGIQVQIAGRLGGKDMARIEWIREGRVPLQTLRAKIDYCSYTVRTIYGALGLKIWIF
uniref:Small ribosomal subunit protein uS3c n=9 Tax=Passiflora TaxID=3684 RepID=A0A7H0TYD7_9ROSI|nr:ribosomal protein S3 [Passiflora laurifolia]YP_009501360.1 ribosomal protein S3 [Passiflora oerstedii]YP_009501517.1 ribosomal protein S3 [Passiflora quadrangularis]YP_009501594.1 ribosomal protein S3 [Passiflora serratodigitata]YP_009942045.1 ribosomal protein S3 [Passiflora miniata]YP_010007196.1 ribosomal protein S3 [Passiflora mucronata]YP_010007430.1 ribosomal protein S3 [Passiflora watsoniana]QVX27846.1 ribosomal protein S3 [Passiflora elegans]QVX27923.1 ribosomal protein S3 [Passi